MTVAEFLTWNDGTDTRYELIDGRPVAMAPVAAGHSVIAANLGHALRVEAPRRLVTRAVKPASIVLTVTIRSMRPTSSSSCTPVAPGMAVIPDPVVSIEVLSPSTVEHDRGRKAYDYRRIPSVQEIVLVASEQRHVVIWRRRGAKWEVEDLIGDAALELETVGVAIPFAAIYADSGV